MRAVCWNGKNKISVEKVPEPKILNSKDAILKVSSSSVCGSDLHLIGGFIPTMRKGDILGHEFIGEVVEVGPEVKKYKTGDRLVVPSFVVCGNCTYCEQGEYSLCDNTNPNDALPEKVFGDTVAGVYGYTHAFGGYAGSHADYIRVPLVDTSAFLVPEGLPDEKVLFVSDALATGYMGADLCDIKAGDTVAVWGCGAVGQSAIIGAFLLGAERVIAIDRFPWRLKLAKEKLGAEILNYEQVNILEALKELTAGRGPDACIDCVGQEAHGMGYSFIYDRIKQAMMLESDRPLVIREAILACRKGGTVSLMGVYGGLVDKIPMGAAMNKALTFKMGQQFGQKYAPKLLDHIQKGEIDTSYFVSHRLPLEEGARGYDVFKYKHENVMRVVFYPEMKKAA